LARRRDFEKLKAERNEWLRAVDSVNVEERKYACAY
jgi:hypothetical protein